MKRKHLSVLALYLFAAALFPNAAHAKRPPRLPDPKPVTIKAPLLPNPAVVDLGGSAGKIDYRSKKRNIQLKTSVLIVGLPASLGIVDLQTARTLDLHLELSRNGTVYNDCFFKFSGEDDLEMADGSTVPGWKYKLHVKTPGRQSVLGACGNGVPLIEPGDSIGIYANVGGVRVDVMTKP